MIEYFGVPCVFERPMGTTSSNFELDEETKLTKLSSSADFKKLVVCGTRDKNVNEKLREHQIIETNGSYFPVPRRLSCFVIVVISILFYVPLVLCFGVSCILFGDLVS